MPAKSHGYTGTRLYNTWLNVKQRCGNPKNPRSKSYGARGINVCDDWKISFESFKKWALNNGYSDELTIDRIDVNGIYEPSNCRWITNGEQQLNRRNNRNITFNGVTKTISEWAREKGFAFKTLQGRLNTGWEIGRALNSPLIPKQKCIAGDKFGRITALYISRIGDHGAIWHCACECGNYKDIRGSNLTSGSTKSCGCIQKEVARTRLLRKEASL